jgi:hypothetical protein
MWRQNFDWKVWKVNVLEEQGMGGANVKANLINGENVN